MWIKIDTRASTMPYVDSTILATCKTGVGASTKSILGEYIEVDVEDFFLLQWHHQ